MRRFPAVDGTDRAALDAGWAACGRPAFDPIDPKFAERPGRQGCFLSHLLLWKAILEQELPFACVFEDDVLFHRRWDVLAPAYFAATPPDYDLLFLGALLYPPDRGFVQRAPTFHMHAYLITRDGARRLRDRLLRAPTGVFSLDDSINALQNAILRGEDPDPFGWYAWSGLPFPDPAANRIGPHQTGLVFQDWSRGGSTTDGWGAPD